MFFFCAEGDVDLCASFVRSMNMGGGLCTLETLPIIAVCE